MISKKGKIGRRPVADKKESVAIYIKKSEIKDFGGKDQVRAFLESSWNNKLAAKEPSLT